MRRRRKLDEREADVLTEVENEVRHVRRMLELDDQESLSGRLFRAELALHDLAHGDVRSAEEAFR